MADINFFTETKKISDFNSILQKLSIKFKDFKYDDILFKTGLETAINNLDNCKNLQFGGGKVARIIYAYKVSEQIKRYFNLYILIFKLNAHKNFKILISISASLFRNISQSTPISANIS